MQMYTFTLVLLQDTDGGYTVHIPTLHGCKAHGLTQEDAIANAHEAIKQYIADLKAIGEPVPEEKVPPMIYSVEV